MINKCAEKGRFWRTRFCNATLLQNLAPTVITAIEEALSAMKTDEADHLTRLQSVERYCELLELAQGKRRRNRGRR
jgi:hypothetical protein